MDIFETYEPPIIEVPQVLDRSYPYDKNNVWKLMGKLKPKSSASFIKEHLREFVDVLTSIINQSFTESKFSDSWKTAILRPLLKKPNLDFIDSNYCPVSNLSFISKIVEHAALDRLVFHVNFNDIIPSHQSGYKANHSCKTL